jgi:ABC-type glycerol-3-phosphate transport system substrate-binding protein
MVLLWLILLPVVLVRGQDNQTPESTVITVWLPDALVAPESDETLSILQAQTDAFVSANPDASVVLRLKQVGTTGGIMATLRTGSVVAPGALPTLTLLRWQDLVMAQRGGLLQSIEGLLPSVLLADVTDVLQLGQIDNILYGVPYVLDLQHIALRARSGADDARWDYASVLERAEPFTFAAARATGLSDVLFAQYLMAGASLAENGMLLLDEDALRTTYAFYEQAHVRELLYEGTAGFQAIQDYLPAFSDGEPDMAVIDSGTFLRLQDAGDDLQVASLPSPQDETLSVLNGWVWVVVTTNPDHRVQALQYVSWMMDVQRLVEVARSAYVLPARRSAMLEPLAGGESGEPFLNLIEHAVLPITDGDGGTLARLIQEGLIAVLSGERSADQAVQDVLTRQTP